MCHYILVSNTCDINDVAVSSKNVCIDIDARVEQWYLMQRLDIEAKSQNISKLAMS